MAEYVSFRIEELVPFFEELQRTRLYNETEVKKIINDFKNFEYKIESRERKLNDVLEYIGYETQLLRSIKQRRKLKNFKDKKQEIEDKLKFRIHSQFGSAKRLFSHDLQFWKSYLDFLQQLKSWSAVSSLFQELIRLHGSKYPHLYKSASYFELDLNPVTGIETARHCYQEGLNMHPNDKDLKLDAFSLELKYIGHLHQNEEALRKVLTRKNGRDIVQELKIVKLLYNKATKEETGPQVFWDFFLAAQPYQFTGELQQEIIEDIRERCETSEEIFDRLAKISISNKDIPRGIQQYHMGLQLMPTEKMYDYFLKTLWTLISITKVPMNYVNIALPIFEQAQQSKKLTVNGFLLWIRVLRAVKSNCDCRSVKEVMELGIERFNDKGRDVKWPLHVEYIEMSLKEHFNATDVLTKLDEINNPQIPESFWKNVFYGFILNDVAPSDLKKLVEMTKNDNVKVQLRILLLKHFGYQLDLDGARKYYKKLQGVQPYSFNFHKIMIELELLQRKDDTLSIVRNYYQNAIYLFGPSLPEVWISAIEFERRFGGDQARASFWHSTALSTLRTEILRETFLLQLIKK